MLLWGDCNCCWTWYFSHLDEHLANDGLRCFFKWTYLYFWKHVYCSKPGIHCTVCTVLLQAFIKSVTNMQNSSLTSMLEKPKKWIRISFPINSHGIMFAIVELTSSLINFSQIPITDAVKLNQDFDLLTYLLIGLSLIIVLRKVFEPCL